jgi:hypothetical protein
MMRPRVLLGAFFLLRAMLRRGSRCSPTAISPYVNGLDGIIPAQQLSSVLDEVQSYQSWAINQRSDASTDAQIGHLAIGTLQ